MADSRGEIKIAAFLKSLDMKRLKIVAVSTTAFMLAAYMYAYTNGISLFDAARIYRGAEKFSVGSDKWAITFLGLLDAHINEPWLAGIWAVFFMIVSVYFIVEILEIKGTWGVCLVAGLCSTQSSIICQQQYTGGQYTGEIALAFACLAAWIFLTLNIKAIWKVILTSICIAISAGIYGAYISMVPSLMILSIIIDIIYKRKSAKTTWKKAIASAGQFLAGMILYYAILRTGLYFTSSQLKSYMGQDTLSSVQGIVEKHNFIVEAYQYIIRYYLNRLPVNYLPDSLGRMAFIGLIIGTCISIITFFQYRKKIVDFKYNIVLLLALIFVLPFSLNLIYVFASGNVHQLMIFTYVLPYIFFVKIMEMVIDHSEGHIMEYLLSTGYKIIMCIFIYYSVVMANAVIVHLNNMYVIAQSIGTRILDRIESCSGFDGTETVHLIGNMQHNEYFTVPVAKAEILNANLGMARPDQSNALNKAFLVNILDSGLHYDLCGSVEAFIEELIEEGVDENIIKQIEEMPAFPYDGSVQKIGEDIYVIFVTDEMREDYYDKYGL